MVESSTKNPVWGSEEDIEAEKKRLGYVEGIEEPVWEGPEPKPGTAEYKKFHDFLVESSRYWKNQHIGLCIEAGCSHILASSFDEAEDI